MKGERHLQEGGCGCLDEPRQIALLGELCEARAVLVGAGPLGRRRLAREGLHLGRGRGRGRGIGVGVGVGLGLGWRGRARVGVPTAKASGEFSSGSRSFCTVGSSRATWMVKAGEIGGFRGD